MKDLTNENVIHVKNKEVEYLQFRKLLEYSDKINHAYCLGLDKNFRTGTIDYTPVSDDKKQKAIKDYILLTEAIGTDYRHIIKSQQRHTKNIKSITNIQDGPVFDGKETKDVDGLITNKQNILLSTTNADCILMFFYDPVKNVIANTHSGWRGTLQRISVETVKKMQEEYGSKPEDIICCMCPSIRKCHFEVEKDVKKEFEEEFKEIPQNEFIEESIPDTKWNIDTIYINKELLKTIGLKEKNIIDSGVCSVCESDQVHSFRAEGENYGLATAIIEIKG